MLSNSATTKKVDDSAADEAWVGFLCKSCGAPLALHRSSNGSKPGERSTRGWRILCTSCGVPDFYELGSAMVQIKAT